MATHVDAKRPTNAAWREAIAEARPRPPKPAMGRRAWDRAPARSGGEAVPAPMTSMSASSMSASCANAAVAVTSGAQRWSQWAGAELAQ